jgi:hypothetical protein
MIREPTESAPEAGRGAASDGRVAARLTAAPNCSSLPGTARNARGEGHAVSVLTVTYPGGRTRQFSVRRERAVPVATDHDTPRKPGAGAMIEMRRAQLSFDDGLIVAEVSDLREDWMKHADTLLTDEDIVAAVYEVLAKRHPKSRSRGRLGTSAETVLRLLILKHIRNWSYAVL